MQRYSEKLDSNLSYPFLVTIENNNLSFTYRDGLDHFSSLLVERDLVMVMSVSWVGTVFHSLKSSAFSQVARALVAILLHHLLKRE